MWDWYTGAEMDPLFGFVVAQGTYWTNVDCKN